MLILKNLNYPVSRVLGAVQKQLKDVYKISNCLVFHQMFTFSML